jgi:pyruvate formate lyase activating enzyme
MEEKILITDIQRYAVNDGPGFRTNVFLKGCPLRCAWCHNPETIAPYPELYWKRRLCTQCGACLDACPNEAVNPPIAPEEANAENQTYHKIIRSRCTLCMQCVAACRYDALSIAGRPMSVAEILDEVERDKPFYANSGGGMTLSGGEPTAKPQFSELLLKGARERGIHTCLDTNGFCSFQILERLAREVDIVLFDLKHLDNDRHAEKTGVGNELILSNLHHLADAGIEIWVRIPVVPDFNDTLDFHRRTAWFLSSLKHACMRVDLLPYHNWCQDKYSWLDIDWEYRDVEAIDPSFLDIHADLYRERGLKTTVGGSGFEEVNAAFKDCEDNTLWDDTPSPEKEKTIRSKRKQSADEREERPVMRRRKAGSHIRDT